MSSCPDAGVPPVSLGQVPGDPKPPRVSVVLPVHNGEEQLEVAVDSILQQTLHDLELIVVDDGSTDRTPTLLQQLAERDPRLRVCRQEHGGIVAALNQGARLARAPYLARMDADDISVPDRLDKQAAFLDANADVALVGGSVEYILGEGRRIRFSPLPTAPAEIAERLIAGKHCFVHPTVMIRTEALAQVGGYRAAFEGAEDADLWLRLAERFALANLPDVVLAKSVHPGQVSTRRMEEGIVRRLAAEASARLRRATGQDPLRRDEAITSETLRRLGVNEQEVREELLDGYRTYLRGFHKAGDFEGAIRLFREVRMPWRIRYALRTEYALSLLRQAKRDYAGRRWMRSGLGLFHACLVRPSLPLAKLVTRARSVIPS
jgi:glycosyltransferase involved in cell wall biosynthesis